MECGLFYYQVVFHCEKIVVLMADYTTIRTKNKVVDFFSSLRRNIPFRKAKDSGLLLKSTFFYENIQKENSAARRYAQTCVSSYYIRGEAIITHFFCLFSHICRIFSLQLFVHHVHTGFYNTLSDFLSFICSRFLFHVESTE